MAKIAFVFPGQGAQYPGMGEDLYIHSNAARELFDALGSGVKDLCFHGAKEELKSTKNAQPALYAVDLACALALKELGVVPAGAAGFSLGEIPALAFSHVFSPEEGFLFVKARAEAMDRAAGENPGEMYAVLRLDKNQVEEICKTLPAAFPANYNCPGQLVVAVSKESASPLAGRVLEANGRMVRLAVSGAFHSPFMRFAGEEIFDYLSGMTLCRPDIPVYSNVTGRPYGEGEVPALLKAQAASPVRWQETIENMTADGFDTFIETGAGTVLSGLIKKICPRAAVYAVSDQKSLLQTVEELKHV